MHDLRGGVGAREGSASKTHSSAVRILVDEFTGDFDKLIKRLVDTLRREIPDRLPPTSTTTTRTSTTSTTTTTTTLPGP